MIRIPGQMVYNVKKKNVRKISCISVAPKMYASAPGTLVVAGSEGGWREPGMLGSGDVELIVSILGGGISHFIILKSICVHVPDR
jgi:hypothetical protein